MSLREPHDRLLSSEAPVFRRLGASGRLRIWVAVTGLVLHGCRGGEGTATPPTPQPPQAASPADPEARERTLPPGEADSPRIALGTQGAVTSAQPDASRVGLEILQAGGNAVDAAVAVAFALAVTHPSAGNIGGGGFMVVRMADGTMAAIDYREEAPGKASRDMYLDDKGEPTGESLVGAKAAGIPGTVSGMALAHEKFGSMEWERLLAPAIELAQEGHVVDSWHAEDIARGVDRMKTAGLLNSMPYYTKGDGTPYAEGDRWVQPELAETLSMIATKGPRSFYEGEFAKAMADAVREAGGIWQASDLAKYRAKEREPLVFPYRGREIITMPPPSAGGVVLRQILAASELLDLEAMPWRSVEEAHYFVEICKRTYADRNLLLGDPDFVDLPMKRLLDVSYVDERVADISAERATPSEEIKAGIELGKEESHQTTHFSVVDAEGNAVSNTYTLNLGFGSRFVAPGGVLLNNEMDDFAVKPGTANVFGLVQGEQNAIEPGKRMLSSMTPTIVVEDGELRAIVGTPGGPTITTTVAQIIRALIDYGLDMGEAVEATRIHHQWLPDMIWSEDRMDEELAEGLRALGHELRMRGGIGAANSIEVDPKTRGFRAVADVTRDGGLAVAY